MASTLSWGRGKLTQTAGTVIVAPVPPRRNKKTKVTKVVVTTSTTAHTLTAMRPLGQTTLTAATAAGASPVIALTADPGDYSNVRTADNNIAANDYVVIECPDGSIFVATVASVSSLNVTLNETAPTLGFAAGAKVWFYGITTDTNPVDATAHPQFTLAASGTNTLQSVPGDRGAVVESYGKYEPILLYINNATAASVLEEVEAVYETD